MRKGKRRSKIAEFFFGADPWAAYLRWNRSQTTGLSREDLKVEQHLVEEQSYEIELTDLAVDTDKINTRKRQQHEAHLISALKDL